MNTFQIFSCFQSLQDLGCLSETESGIANPSGITSSRMGQEGLWRDLKQNSLNLYHTTPFRACLGVNSETTELVRYVKNAGCPLHLRAQSMRQGPPHAVPGSHVPHLSCSDTIVLAAQTGRPKHLPWVL